MSSEHKGKIHLKIWTLHVVREILIFTWYADNT